MKAHAAELVILRPLAVRAPAHSRAGKLLNPKFGILKIIIEGFLSGRIKDMYICPISIGYDRVRHRTGTQLQRHLVKRLHAF